MEVLNWLGSNVVAIFTGVGITLGLVFLARFIPKFIGNEFSKRLNKAMANVEAIEDPKRKAFAQRLAQVLVEWAEYEIPDQGQGKARYRAVAEKLCKFIPALKGKDEKIAELIENSVVTMDNILKSKINPASP